MPSEWPMRHLSEVARDLTVGFVGTMADQYAADGVPFLRSLNVRPFEIDLKEVKYISRDFHNRLQKSALRPGDVVIVRTGKPGTCAVVPDKLKEANCSDVVIVRCGEELRPHFLSYWVNAMAASHVNAHTVGAVQQHFNVASAKALRLPVPPLPAQDEVLVPLRAIDEKIALLRETNATLEAIAQALFKSWFVDFDPVRAKAEGRDPEGMPPEVADLFPSEFEDSELGEIPKGWSVLPFLDVCDLLGGAQPPASTFINAPQEGYVRLLQIRDFGTDAHLTFVPDSKKLKKVTADDVLIGRYGSASGNRAKDSLGRVCRGLSGAYNVALMKLEPKLVGREFAQQLVTAPSFYNYLQGVSSKAVQSGFSKAELGNLKIVTPPRCLADVYEAFGQTVWASIKANNHRSKTLEEIRDTLLPRLMSGKLLISQSGAVQ